MNIEKKIKGLRKLIEEKRHENNEYSKLLSQFESYRIRFLDDIEYCIYPAHSIFSSDSDSDSYSEDNSDSSSDSSYHAPIPKKTKSFLSNELPNSLLTGKSNITTKKNATNSNQNQPRYQSAQPINNQPSQSQIPTQYQQQVSAQMIQFNSNLLKKLFPSASTPSLVLKNSSLLPNSNQSQESKQIQNIKQSQKVIPPQNLTQAQKVILPQNPPQAQKVTLPQNPIQAQSITPPPNIGQITNKTSSTNKSQSSNKSQSVNKSQSTNKPHSTDQINSAILRSRSAPVPNQTSTVVTGKHFLYPKSKPTPQPTLYQGSIPGQMIPNKSQNIYEYTNIENTQSKGINDNFFVRDQKVVDLINKYRSTLQRLQEQQFMNYLQKLSFKSNITTEIVEEVYMFVQQGVKDCRSIEIIENYQVSQLDPITSFYLQSLMNSKSENGCNQMNLNMFHSKLSLWSKVSGKMSDQFLIHFPETVKPSETAKFIDNINTKALKYDQKLSSNFYFIDDSIYVDDDDIDNNNKSNTA